MTTMLKGYMLIQPPHDEDDGVIMEVLYAVKEDGTVLRSEPHPQRDTFAGGVWEETDVLPQGAYFIGNYLTT